MRLEQRCKKKDYIENDCSDPDERLWWLELG